MSETIDDLEDIADSVAFGFNGNTTHVKRVRRERCAGGHLWTSETTMWSRGRGRRYRRCKLCRTESRSKTLARCAEIATNRSDGPSISDSELIAAHAVLDTICHD